MTALWVARQQGQPDRVPELCRLLAGKSINIAFMTSTVTGDAHSALCCIEAGDETAATAHINRHPQLCSAVRVAELPVGLLSVYPHRASLSVLGTALHILQDLDITVHSLASSIAALTFVVDYDKLDKAITTLADALKLGADQIVRQPEYRIKQVVPPDMGQQMRPDGSLSNDGEA